MPQLAPTYWVLMVLVGVFCLIFVTLIHGSVGGGFDGTWMSGDSKISVMW